MRYFRSSGFHISSLPTGLRFVLTLYLVANLFGLVVSSAKFLQRMDPTPASVTEYYLGDPAAPAKIPQVIRQAGIPVRSGAREFFPFSLLDSHAGRA